MPPDATVKATLLRPEVFIDSARNPRPTLYPASLFIVASWTVFIAILLLLLEGSAADAARSLKRPWYYDPLPSIFLTIFAQGHSAVTVVHFSRLAASALHLPGRGPASWQELFWQVDHSWSGPIGIASVVFFRLKQYVALSSTFFLFTATCIVALVTPVLLSRAYPIKNIVVPVEEPIRLNVFSSPHIHSFDAYAQLAIGGGAWSTRQSLIGIFNTSTFVPAGKSREEDQVDDVFFVGEIAGSVLKLPGIRTQGGCQVISNSSVDLDTFDDQMCSRLPRIGDKRAATVEDWNAHISLDWCSEYTSFSTFLSTPTSSVASAYIRINATNENDTVSGVAMCNVTLFTGTAQLDGRDGTFTDFREEAIYNGSKAQGGEPLLHPLSAALLTLTRSVYYTNFSAQSIVYMLGYVPEDRENEVEFNQPSLDQMVQRIWQGSTHMGSAVGLLAQRRDSYRATFYKPSSGRIVDPLLSKVSWAMLGLWLFLAFLSTLLLFRRTTMGNNLSAFTAAWLVWEHFESAAGRPWLGGLEAGTFLKQRFDGGRYSKRGENLGMDSVHVSASS